ncbi:hypothetical protein HMPREF9721_00313 [Treponema denticola ATCC 35404]|nr:hypothetical protein HMPREF9721_00313 [Treponema denticola ATCC 35404]
MNFIKNDLNKVMCEFTPPPPINFYRYNFIYISILNNINIILHNKLFCILQALPEILQKSFFYLLNRTSCSANRCLSAVKITAKGVFRCR